MMQFLDNAAGVIDALRIRALDRRGKPLRIKIDGSTYYLNSEPTALFHARHSMSKLVRMVALIENATSIFDVGANCGIFAALCARKFPTATIHAFEPAPALQSTLALNCSAANISLHQLGVGERDELATLYVNPHSQQTNSLQFSALAPFLDSTTVETEEIRCVSLDSFMSANTIAPIDVLKVDVQGLEGAVLRGAQTTLESVQYLFLEVTWLDLEGVQRILPAAEHYGFNYVAVVNEVYTGADLLFTRKPLTTEVKNVLRFPLGAESAGKQWF
jgi:FkbM family methyltransferase